MAPQPALRIVQLVPAAPGWRVAYTVAAYEGRQYVAAVAAWALCEDGNGNREVVGMISARDGRLGLVTDYADPATMASPGAVYLGPDEVPE